MVNGYKVVTYKCYFKCIDILNQLHIDSSPLGLSEKIVDYDIFSCNIPIGPSVAKDGFWIDENFKFTEKEDKKYYWVSQSSIVSVVRIVKSYEL